MSFLSEHIPWQVPADSPSRSVDQLDGLIERCLAGDTPAYAVLYQKHASYVYRLVYGLLQHREDAEEVLQDTFEYAFRRLDQFDPQKSAFKTWLYRIAISRSRNKRRRKWLPTFSIHQLLTGDGTELSEPRDIPDRETPAPEEHLELTGRQKLVWEAIGQLSDKLRETAVLRYYEGFSYQEIGAVLGIPPKTAESRMRLAHKALKELLAGKI